MSDPVLIEIKLDGTTEGIYCEKISAGIYICLESCLMIESIKYGCEIEVKEIDGKLNFIKLYKRSPFATYCYIWSKEIIESEKCKRMLDEVLRIDGYWEGAMGGLLMIHLPIVRRNEIDRLLGMMKDE
ncbi:MAG TPA: hypothetical protein VFU29_15110 [Chitinophagaceae bacterium]|nr:hypothetical protein [Chitinophagaceae bacterium]